MILGVSNAPKERGKYAFESERLGGPDPAMRYSWEHAAQLRAALNEASDDLDPSLANAVSAYGHLGYNPLIGTPNPDQPVQAQYSGTWATWMPPNVDPRVGQLQANHMLDYLQAE